MEILISSKEHAENQVANLVVLLQSMDFVEGVKIKTDNLKKSKKDKVRFDKYNGIWQSKLSIDEIDKQLNELRNEWDRTI